MIEKQCTKCEVVKSFFEFYREARNNDGKQSQCRGCQREKVLKWRQNNIEDMHWNKNIRERCNEYQRRYKKDRCANDFNFKL